jgi:hypothetical protein
MRCLALMLLLLPLAACASGPGALGITGPGATQVAQPPAEPDTNAVDPTQGGSRYAPGMIPTTSGGRYWGYN